MAKPLSRPQPSSTVARLFDGSAAARALAVPDVPAPEHPDATPQVQSAPSLVSIDAPTCNRNLLLTKCTAQTLDRLVTLYRSATGTRLTTSHVMRALLLGVEHAFDSLEREARGVAKTKLPSNARERIREREEFERRLAAAFVTGMRATSMMPRD
jgi:hypothetical protein